MEQETLKSIIRKGLIQEYKELLVPEYTLGWKMERWCREHEINSMSFDNTIAAILAEVDKAALTPEQIQQCEDNFREDCDFYFSDPAHDLDDTEAPRNVLDYVAAAQLEAIKKQLRGEGK